MAWQILIWKKNKGKILKIGKSTSESLQTFGIREQTKNKSPKLVWEILVCNREQYQIHKTRQNKGNICIPNRQTDRKYYDLESQERWMETRTKGKKKHPHFRKTKNRSNIRHEFWGTVQIHNLDGQNNTGET
jgi:hypothetical protein